MKKSILMIVFVAMATLFGQKAFCQVDFEVSNTSGFLLYGLFVSQAGADDWSADLLPNDTFGSGTSATVTIPEGYDCSVDVKVSYQVSGETYEETIARADVCKYTGITIQKKTPGSSGSWMKTQYLGTR